jgi:hypothetical protein
MSSITRIDRKAFIKARERARDQGFVFTLPDASLANGEDFQIRLRRISLDEKAAVNGITQSMQDEVYKRTRALVEWQADQAKRKVKPADQLESLQNSETLKRSVNAVCVAAWIEPALVEDEADLERNPDAWHVDDFTVGDRWAAFQAITNADSAEAKRLTLFRPEPADDVPHSAPVQDAAPPKRGAQAS